uniref:WD repeat domain 66 n=1 Tax=Gouania willdenowi TaxID=441366 RepID=A0A8C5DZB1_GOUWI
HKLSYKIKIKTLLGPTYDSPIEQILVLPKSTETDSYYLAFRTEDKVGLQILPVDGNPYKSNAVICHPTGASAFTCSHDGRFIFTTGRSDCTLMSWEFNANVLEAAAALGGDNLEPFLSLIDGGKNGKFYQEMEDFFFYCQIRHQGTDSMEEHKPSDKIPLSEVPALMRALAFFPTEQEIEDMQNEVKFSKYAEMGNYVTDIDLGEFIKLYVNHRPAFGIYKKDLARAFQVLGSCDIMGTPVLNRQELMELLQVRGEGMTEEEVSECFTTLLGLNDTSDEEGCSVSKYSMACAIPNEISMETFVGHILKLPSPPE